MVDKKIVIELDLDNPESRYEATLMLKAVDMDCAINGYYTDVLRKYIRGHVSLTESQETIVEKIVDELRDYFEEFTDYA